MTLLWFEHICFNSGGSDGSLDVSEQEVLLSPEGVPVTLLGSGPPVSVLTSADVSVCGSSKLPAARSSSVPAVPCVSACVFSKLTVVKSSLGLFPCWVKSIASKDTVPAATDCVFCKQGSCKHKAAMLGSAQACAVLGLFLPQGLCLRCCVKALFVLNSFPQLRHLRANMAVGPLRCAWCPNEKL